MNSKAFRVFNSRTRIVEETLHITFLENKPNVARSGPTWLFDIDTLKKSMNYKPVVTENQSIGSAGETKKKDAEALGYEDNEVTSTEEPRVNQEKEANVNNTNNINIVSPTTNADSTKNNVVDENIVYGCTDDPNMPDLEEFVYSDEDDDVGAEADMTNLDTNIPFNATEDQPQRFLELPACLFSITSRTQEEGIDYDEVFAPVARIEAIRLFLAYVSFKDFVVYQMDVKSAFMYGKIEEEVYVCQPLGFKDPEFPDKVYKVEKALYGLHQAPKAWYETLSTYLLDNGFHRAGSESHPPMLNKKNYVPWSSRLLRRRYAKTQDPLAIMANSNNPYVFPAPHQDQPSFNQNYLQQPMPNPEDITDPTTAMNMALALMAKAFKLNYSTPTNKNQRILSNPRNRQIAQSGNGRNQFRQYAGQNAGNMTGYNDVIRNQVIQNAVQNPRGQNTGNQNGLIGVQGNENQNQIGNGNLVAARAEGNAAGQNGNQIRRYNCRGVGNRYDKKGQNPSKTGQNRAQNGKRGKVNSQKSTKSQT
nr:retrovirus-related Pol polyprotein from transposon TNT 1-94 [Tanacetum cinerariifolium]